MFTFHRVDIAHLLFLRRVRQSWHRNLTAPSLPRAPALKSGCLQSGGHVYRDHYENREGSLKTFARPAGLLFGDGGGGSFQTVSEEAPSSDGGAAVAKRRRLLHHFFTVSHHDGCAQGRGWRYPGVTGQVKEELKMMSWYGHGMGTLGWLGMGLFWLLLLGLIVWLVVRLLPGTGDATTHPTGEPALEVLDRQLALGEIDVEAWQAQRAALLGAPLDRR